MDMEEVVKPMFDLVQERDLGPKISSRTMVYLVSHGQPEDIGSDKLGERGRRQVSELAYSRMIAGISRIYSSPNGAAMETSKILEQEFGVEISKIDCLADVNLKKRLDPEVLALFWSDPNIEITDGESIHESQQRFGDCLNNLVTKHRNDSIAIVSHPMIIVLFNSFVIGGIPQVEDWVYSGYCSCASYEVTRKSWNLVMPPDDSFLTEPSSILDSLPAEVKNKFGL